MITCDTVSQAVSASTSASMAHLTVGNIWQWVWMFEGSISVKVLSSSFCCHSWLSVVIAPSRKAQLRAEATATAQVAGVACCVLWLGNLSWAF